jgi:hypothetical protein
MGIAERGIALLRMRELAETASSVERLKSAIRDIGLGYRNDLLHRDASNAWYRSRSESIQGGANLDVPLERSQYLRGDWSRHEAYYFVGKAKWYDPVNNQYQTRTFSVYSNYDATTDEITALWEPTHEQYMEQQEFSLVGVEFVEKWHKIGTGYRTGMEL